MIAKNEARIKPNSIDPVGDLINRLEKVTPRGRNYLACCPAHKDRTPSLSIGRGDDGRALVKCFAGCTAESICAAIGITLADLMPADSHRQPSGKPHRQAAGVIVKSYDYYDADGELQLRVDRLEPKSFRQRRPDGKGGWIGGGELVAIDASSRRGQRPRWRIAQQDFDRFLAMRRSTHATPQTTRRQNTLPVPTRSYV